MTLDMVNRDQVKKFRADLALIFDMELIEIVK